LRDEYEFVVSFLCEKKKRARNKRSELNYTHTSLSIAAPPILPYPFSRTGEQKATPFSNEHEKEKPNSAIRKLLFFIFLHPPLLAEKYSFFYISYTLFAGVY
jgi:hypothetical protein